MKYIPAFLVLFIFLECTSGSNKKLTGQAAGENSVQNGKVTSAGQDSTGISIHDGSQSDGTKTKSFSGNADTIVWVGVFAKWNYKPGEQFDGNYDTVSKIFVMCSTSQFKKIPSEQIILQQNGNCDVASNRVRVFQERFDSIHLISDSIKVIDATPDKSKAVIYLGNQRKVINLNQQVTKRIQESAVIFNPALLNKASSAAPYKEASPDSITLMKKNYYPNQIKMKRAGLKDRQ